jgi:tight adherence protein B
MIRRAAFAALFAILAVASAAQAAATDGLTARMSTAAQLPFRAIVLGLPSDATLTGRSVHVYENGEPVQDVTVVPASSAPAGQFGVVLVIDASNSMHGDPIEQATAAARQFATRIPPGTKFAVVSFNSKPTVLLPFTTDPAQIEQALNTPPTLAQGTHIYDAVQASVAMIQHDRVPNASIVLLSDGSDTGSTASEERAAAAAQKAGIPVYSIGLASAAFDPEALQRLADDSHGTFQEANSPDALAAIYDRLGRQVANQYLIRYRTAQGAGQSVKVGIKVDGFGYAQTAYRMPGAAAGPPFYRSRWAQFWGSPVGMLIIVLGAAALLGFGVAAAARPGTSGVQARVGQFVAVNTASTQGEPSSTTLLSSKLAASAERSLGHTSFWSRFRRDVELAEMDVQPMQLLLAGVVGAVLVGWLIAVVSGLPLLGLLGLSVLFIPNAIVQSKLRKKRAAFAEQLPDNLQVMASAMRAGHSFVGALAVVTEDSPEPSASEFRRVVADEQLGVPLELAMGSAVERMDSRDLGQVALVAALQRETGGNTAEVLDRVTDTIRERFQLRRLVRTLTAQGRMSRWVVSALPVGLLLIISALNPSYERPMFTTSTGRVLLIIATTLIVSGSLVIRKIVNIKV